MAHKNSIQQLEDDGFEIYSDSELAEIREAKIAAKGLPPAPLLERPTPPPQSKVIIMDNKEVLSAVQESNETLRVGLEQLIYSMKSKPDSFTLDIVRDERGFMKSIKVNINR